MVNVAPQVETDPVSGSGDVADHAMVWLHPTDLTRSLIVGTSKDTTQGGMHVFDLEGTEVDFLQVGACNNLDIRYGFPLGSNTIDLIGTSNRTLNRVQFFTIDPDTGELTVLGTHTVDTADIYGFCLAHDRATGKFYSIATFLDGTVEQYELDGSTGSIVATKKRTISVGSQTEGAVADDDLGFLYLAEEDVGVWRYGLDPSSGSTRTAVDNVSGHLTADVEGMALYRESDNANGYLIVSSQGDSTFQVYERDDQTWVGEIAVVAGNGIDAVSDTDGISVTNRNLGAPFASGAFVVHDGAGSDPTNYKLVSWADIATALSLRTPDTTFDPRGGVGPTDITWGEWSNPVQTADPGGVVWGEYSEEVIATQVVGSQVEPEPDPPVITSDQVDDAWSGDFSRAPGFWIRPTQSCHWWNAAAQRWDGLIPDDSGSDHHIVTGINGAQDWEIEVEGRASVRCDTWWDESSATLYVAAQHSSDSTLYRITYNSGNDTYTLAATTSIPSAFQIGAEPDSGELRPLVIHRSPNGNLWLAQNNENELWVSRSTDNGATWATPVDLKSVNGDRGSVGFGDGPGGLVVLFAAENSGGDYYAFSIAQDAGAITAGNWTNESGSLPALTGGVGSDDHICVRSHDGVVYAVCKTENPGSGDDFHVLFVRDTNGDWSKITILEGPDAGNRPSRPSIAIDAEWNRLFYFTAYIADNVVDYRAAYLDSLEDLATESFVEVMEGNYVWFTGGITPKLPVNHESGLLIMGNDQGNTGGTPFADIWWGHLTISEAPEESPGESPGESPAEEPEVEAALA